MVVRDKHHHPVTDLRPEEVEIYEDGVRQNVRVFRNIQGTEQLANRTQRSERPENARHSAREAANDPHPLNSMRQVNFVSVVFAEIAPLDLEFARRAVQEFLKSDNLPNTYVTIYRLDRSMQVMQSYTTDKDSLAKAVDVSHQGIERRRRPECKCNGREQRRCIAQRNDGEHPRFATTAGRHRPGSSKRTGESVSQRSRMIRCSQQTPLPRMFRSNWAMPCWRRLAW